MSDPATPTPEQTSTPQTPTAETPAAEPKPNETLLGEQKPAAETPPAFDPTKLKLPEGFEKTEQFEQFTNLAKEIPGLTGESAQKLFDLHTAVVKQAAEASTAAWEKQNADWQAEIKADPEIGGTKLEGVLQTVSRVMDNADLTDPKFKEALNFTGAGNNPAIVRTLARWAKALSEGSAVSGNPPARNADGSVRNEPRNLAQAIYGPTGPHTGGPKLS